MNKLGGEATLRVDFPLCLAGLRAVMMNDEFNNVIVYESQGALHSMASFLTTYVATIEYKMVRSYPQSYELCDHKIILSFRITRCCPTT